MAMDTHDVIDELVGIAPGSRLDAIRAERPQARENAQASYDALFNPSEPGDMTLAERFAVAAFVAGLHERPRIRDFYAVRLAAQGDAAVASAVHDMAAAGRAQGPYGAYPPGPLSAEDQAGLVFVVAPETRRAIGARLGAALEHAHLLVFHPRDASAGGAAGAARRRVDDHGRRHALAARRLPVVSDPGDRRPERPRHAEG